MRKRLLIAFFAAMFCASAPVVAQDYVNAPVEISKVIVNLNGASFYSHLVLEKQTLFSICKTYGVSLQDVYDANADLEIEKNGLKAGSSILIPRKAGSVAQVTGTDEKKAVQDNSVITHTVKWYEDLESIAKNYNVSPEAIMAFNNLSSTKLGKRQVLRIPSGDFEIQNVSDEEFAETVPSEEEQSGIEAKEYSPNDRIRVNVVLPFNTASNPSDRYFDFYSGVLLAAQNLKELGISTVINAYDISVEDYSSDSCDIVIGPVSPKDIETAEAGLSPYAGIVSPLDSRAAALAQTYPSIIQAPGSAESQTADIISWIKEDSNDGDRLILFSEKDVEATSIADSLAASGLEYESYSYGILEGRVITSSLERMITQTGTNRILIASDNEAFVNDVVRNLNLLVFAKYDIVLYAASRIRSYNTIEAESLHNVNLHSSLSYYVDYDNLNVRKFLLEYRALFCAEPSQYSYQGYDITRCMVEQYVRNGNLWIENLDGAAYSGLQADFLFRRIGDGGYLNRAVRRIVYEKDYSTRLIPQ